MSESSFDVIVIGGGAAGLSGALTLVRARRSVLVLDAGEPRNGPASGVHGLLSTRRTYVGYIERTISPAIGSVAIDKMSARTLETLYSELRRCRDRCDGRPRIERHKVDGEHDCVKKRCVPHVCKAMAASTVRQIHSIISGALAAAVRWDWIAANPARIAQRPRAKAPEPDPPSAADAARLLDAAFEMDEDWGMLVWLVMTTGIRRGEVCALRWRDIDLDGEMIEIRRNYVLHKGVGVEKDTKTHQMRRIALDSETVMLLREHRAGGSPHRGARRRP